MGTREDILDWKSSPSKERKKLCILVVNDDVTCRNIVDEMLKHCHYEELYGGRISEAMKIMSEKKDMFELVLTNAHSHRLESDEYGIIQYIQNQFDLSTVLLSPDDMKLATKAQDYIVSAYIVNSLSRNDINSLWQSAVEKVKANKLVGKTDNEDSKDDSNKKKKARMVWTRELHQKFLQAIDILGYQNVVPTKIRKVMNIPGLTREHVASHLQKYRNGINIRNTYQRSCSFQPLLASRSYNPLPRHMEPSYTSAMSLRQPRNSGTEQELKTYDEISRQISCNDVNMAPENPASTGEYVGLRLANDGKSITFLKRKVSSGNAISIETIVVSDLGTTSNSYIEPNMISSSSPTMFIRDCISQEPFPLLETPENSSFHHQPDDGGNDFLLEKEMNNVFVDSIGTSYAQYNLDDLDDSLFLDDNGSNL